MKAFSILPAAAIFLAASAGAQTPLPKSDSGCVTGPNGRVECRFTRIIRGPDSMYRFDHARMDSVLMKRAILGIELRPTGTKRDTLGVFVEAVIPKGPAENAGIIEGDRIAAINGVDLRASAADVEDEYTNGLSAHRLTREVQKLTPGSRVTLRVYSGGRFRDVQVTAGRASDFMHGPAFRMRFGPGMMHFDGPGMMRFEEPDGMLEPHGMMIEQGPRRSSAGAKTLRAPMELRMPAPRRRLPLIRA